MEQIKKLEAKLRELEIEKVRLLRKEMTGSAKLKYKANVLGFHLDELESIY
jgi:hypothetical protein